MSPSKKRQTMGKVTRERELRERREQKLEKKERKKAAAEAGEPDTSLSAQIEDSAVS